MENPYSWDTRRLLNEFMDACGRAGFSGSGLVISFSAESDLSYAHYLQGVILARVERVEPPLKPGDEVSPREAVTAPSGNGWKRSSSPRKLLKQLTVREVHYLGDNKWLVKFQEMNDQTCDTENEYDQDGGRSWYVPLFFKASDFYAC